MIRRFIAALLALACLIAPVRADTITLTGGWDSLAAVGAVSGACGTVYTIDGSGTVQAVTSASAPAASTVGRTLNFFNPYPVALSATLWVKGPAGSVVGIDTGACLGGSSVGSASPAGPLAVTLTTTESPTIAAAAAGVQILAANASRKFLRVTNDGVGACRVGYGGAPTAATGEPIAAAAGVGQQGGSITFEASAITKQAVWAYCAASSTIAIVEGQ